MIALVYVAVGKICHFYEKYQYEKVRLNKHMLEEIKNKQVAKALQSDLFPYIVLANDMHCIIKRAMALRPEWSLYSCDNNLHFPLMTCTVSWDSQACCAY